MSAFIEDGPLLEQASGGADTTIDESPYRSEVLPSDELSASPELDLMDIAARIRGRDAKSASCSRQVAIDNGLDLLRVKGSVGHGQFGPWCRDSLNYSKSKVERLMRLAKAFGPAAKSVGCTDLPPLDLLHALLAPSTPAPIRDAFVPRIKRGDDVAAELRAALKLHRADGARQKRGGEAGMAREPAAVGDELDHATRSEQQTAAYTRALDLIGEHLGEHLRELLDLVGVAGPGRILTPEATRALADLARTSDALEGGSGEAAFGTVTYGRPTRSTFWTHRQTT